MLRNRSLNASVPFYPTFRLPRFILICNSVQELGYDRPRPDQLEAVVLQFDTFIPLPTRSGKSLCFASLPLMFDKLCEVTDTPNYHSICIVLSPLKAMMQDQVTKFTARGLKAAFVGGGQEERAIFVSVINGDMQLVYFSTESHLTIIIIIIWILFII